jgi:hypothetical protein
MVSLTFRHVSQTGSFCDAAYQLLLGVEARFTLRVGSSVVVQEPCFPIVELRQWLSRWLSGGAGGDFVYTSIEAEEPGLITFRKASAVYGAVGSAWSSLPAEPLAPWGHIVDACQLYVRNVDNWVWKELGLRVDDVLQGLM